MALYRRSRSKNWIWQKMLNGKTYVRSTKSPNKREAERIARKFEEQIRSQILLGDKHPITFIDAINQFQKSKNKTPSISVINTHLNAIKKFFDTNKLLDDITTADIHRFVEYRSAIGIKDNTLRVSISTLKGVFDRAAHLGYSVPDIIFPYIKTRSKRVRFLSKDEEDALLYELDPTRKRKGFGGVQREQIQDLRDLVIILLDTGMRVQEAAQLPWSSVDFVENTIHIFRSKVGNESILAMTDRVREVIQQRYNTKTSAYIFQNRDNGPRRYLPEAFARAMNRAGLNTNEKIQQWGCKATYHTLRHTFASRLAQAGVSIQKIGQLLGHKDIHTTMVYSHLIPNNVAVEAAGILNRMNGVRVDS